MQIELDPHPEFQKPKPTIPPVTQPVPQNPYATPRAVLSPPTDVYDQIQAVAKAQRLLLLSVLASIIGNIIMRASGMFGLAMIPVMLGIAGFSIWCVYKLCKALDRSPVFWIIAMFIPLVNFICLLILNSSATTFLKSNGIKVGLLGAKV